MQPATKAPLHRRRFLQARPESARPWVWISHDRLPHALVILVSTGVTNGLPQEALVLELYMRLQTCSQSSLKAPHSGQSIIVALLKKLAVVATMLAVAYFNRFIAMPRLRAASSK